MVVVAAHTPCLGWGGGGREGLSSARPNTEEGASQGAQCCKAYVSSHFTFQITASWGAKSQNAVVSSRFVFHGVPNPGTWVVPTTSRNAKLWLCVIVCLAAICGTTCRMHFAPGKKPPRNRPIYHFHFNFHFLKAPLAQKVATSPLPSQGPRRGRKCHVTPALSGVPIKGDIITSGYLTLDFSGGP